MYRQSLRRAACQAFAGSAAFSAPTCAVQHGARHASKVVTARYFSGSTLRTEEQRPLDEDEGRSSVKDVLTSMKDKVVETAESITSRGISGSLASKRLGGLKPMRESKIIYAGNLFFEVTEAELEEEFQKYGDVVNVKVVRDLNNLSRGFGYIEYDDIETARAAIQATNRKQFHGGRMMVSQFHQAKESTPKSRPTAPPSKTLYIGNIAFQVEDQELRDLFAPLENIVDIRVAIDRRTGQPRGFAHADFTDVASATKAREYFMDKSLRDRRLHTDFAVDNSVNKRRPFEDENKDELD